jgi:hypothetical protein
MKYAAILVAILCLIAATYATAVRLERARFWSAYMSCEVTKSRESGVDNVHYDCVKRHEEGSLL